MRRTVVLFASLFAVLGASGACNRKHDTQGFRPEDVGQVPAGGASGTGAMPPPPAVGPGALAAQQPQDDLPSADGDMPDDAVHAGLGPHATVGADDGSGAPANPHGGAGDMNAMGFQSPDPSAPIDPSKFLRGAIHPSDATKDQIPAGALIYLSVKRADPATGDAAPGMPIATAQLHATSWPLAFELNQHNLMTSGADFSGDVVVTARFAHDPNPTTKVAGDVVGHVRATIPADKLDVSLDHVMTSDEIKPHF